MCCSPWSHKELDITEQLNWICQTQSCTKVCPWWHAPSIGCYKISLLSRQCIFSVSWHWVYPPKWIRCDLCFQKLVIIIVGIKSDLWRDSEDPCSQLPEAKRKRRKIFTQGQILEPSLKFARQRSESGRSLNNILSWKLCGQNSEKECLNTPCARDIEFILVS